METHLTTFDRIGVAVVALLGAGIGLFLATANDVVLTPMLFVVFPGAAIGLAVSKLAGRSVGVIISGIANGGIYGALLYSCHRLANAVFPPRPAKGLNRLVFLVSVGVLLLIAVEFYRAGLAEATHTRDAIRRMRRARQNQ